MKKVLVAGLLGGLAIALGVNLVLLAAVLHGLEHFRQFLVLDLELIELGDITLQAFDFLFRQRIVVVELGIFCLEANDVLLENVHLAQTLSR